MKQIYKAKLSPHFLIDEFLLPHKYPKNTPTWQDVINMTFGCFNILEPAREIVGPITITSGYRNYEVNRMVGGVHDSQHLIGCAADITCSPDKFKLLVKTLEENPHVDQLLTGETWLHVSWNPFGKPRNICIPNYYK